MISANVLQCMSKDFAKIHPDMPVAEASAKLIKKALVGGPVTDAEGKLVYFMSVDEAKFRKPVVPGDQLFIHVKKKQQRGPVWRFQAEAKVDGALVAEATFAAMIRDG